MSIIKTFLCVLTMVLSSNWALAEKISLATVNWQPFYGDDLPENGFFTAIAREAYKRAGYELVVDFLPWKRALEEARKGKYDGLLGAYYSEDRAKTFYYSDIVHTNDEVFIQNIGRGIEFNQLEGLKRYKIGAMRGSAQLEELRSKGFDVDETTDDVQNLKKLAADRVDLIIMGRQQFYYQLNNSSELAGLKDNFELINPPFKSFELFCAITKKRPDGAEITKKFNAALNEMKSDGTIQAILSRFNQQ
ncbi:amino acid ABC transporter substrate-binding protein [Bacterioplanes sanyensis]|uniref:substrate-binding periplasmic protein n=1 Tax=Bacterioplanes sanyensis TaxID=1249553 RepID=UPI0016728B0E|nr:transporter substrate-binding domain-containing protein [Bacterioplanes sanyensis]GGY47570.1 amino acid ABC transporter substrate-binding protein [Bacterioplanes sanyensis]